MSDRVGMAGVECCPYLTKPQRLLALGAGHHLGGGGEGPVAFGTTRDDHLVVLPCVEVDWLHGGFLFGCREHRAYALNSQVAIFGHSIGVRAGAFGVLDNLKRMVA